jgi:hypothetical protein
VRLVNTFQRRGGTEKVYTICEKRLWAPGLWRGVPPTVGDGLRQFSLREFLSHTLAAIDSERIPVLSWQASEVDQLGWHEILAAADDFHRTVKAAVDRARDKKADGERYPSVKIVTGISAYEPAPAEAVDAWAQVLSEDL